MLKSKFLFGSSMILLGSINVSSADPVNDCHMRDCTLQEKVEYNTNTTNELGEAVVRHMNRLNTNENNITDNTNAIGENAAGVKANAEDIRKKHH